MSNYSYLSRQVLDIRSHTDFLQGHLPGALHIPIFQLLDRYQELCPNVPYCIICEHGVNSLTACEFLQSKGYDAINFPGGMTRLTKQLHQLS